MITELDYINLLPDLSKFQDVNESSFLKGMANHSMLAGNSGHSDYQQIERIKQLELQLEAHKKQIDDLEVEKKSHSTHNSGYGSDNQKSGEEKKESDDLKKQLRQLKKEHEIELVSVKTSLKEELRRM